MFSFIFDFLVDGQTSPELSPPRRHCVRRGDPEKQRKDPPVLRPALRPRFQLVPHLLHPLHHMRDLDPRQPHSQPDRHGRLLGRHLHHLWRQGAKKRFIE